MYKQPTKEQVQKAEHEQHWQEWEQEQNDKQQQKHIEDAAYFASIGAFPNAAYCAAAAGLANFKVAYEWAADKEDAAGNHWDAVKIRTRDAGWTLAAAYKKSWESAEAMAVKKDSEGKPDEAQKRRDIAEEMRKKAAQEFAAFKELMRDADESAHQDEGAAP